MYHGPLVRLLKCDTSPESLEYTDPPSMHTLPVMIMDILLTVKENTSMESRYTFKINVFYIALL